MIHQTSGTLRLEIECVWSLKFLLFAAVACERWRNVSLSIFFRIACGIIVRRGLSDADHSTLKQLKGIWKECQLKMARRQAVNQ